MPGPSVCGDGLDGVIRDRAGAEKKEQQRPTGEQWGKQETESAALAGDFERANFEDNHQQHGEQSVDMPAVDGVRGQISFWQCIESFLGSGQMMSGGRQNEHRHENRGEDFSWQMGRKYSVDDRQDDPEDEANDGEAQDTDAGPCSTKLAGSASQN